MAVNGHHPGMQRVKTRRPHETVETRPADRHGQRMAGANPPFLQSLGWEHYEVHEPEPHILLFKYVRLGSRPALSWMYRASAWLARIRSRNQLTRVTGGRSTTNHLHNEGSMNTMAAVLRQHVYLISHSTTA